MPASACPAACCASTAWTASSRPTTAGSTAVPCAGCCAPWPPTSAASSPPATASGSRPSRPKRRPDRPEGVIERVEPRHGLLTRASRGREHVLVANVDQVVIVMSLVEPDLKPHLIDRYLASAEQGGIAPILCLNKADLVDPEPFQPLIGLYSQLGIPALPDQRGHGTRHRPAARAAARPADGLLRPERRRQVVAAQRHPAGPGAARPRGERVNQKGRHTTTTAELIRLDFGGWVVDTPGIRQFELWDIIPEEVEGFFPEFRPFVPLCAYPDCTHTHEDRCAVKRAVDRRQISAGALHAATSACSPAAWTWLRIGSEPASRFPPCLAARTNWDGVPAPAGPLWSTASTRARPPFERGGSSHSPGSISPRRIPSAPRRVAVLPAQDERVDLPIQHAVG